MVQVVTVAEFRMIEVGETTRIQGVRLDHVCFIHFQDLALNRTYWFYVPLFLSLFKKKPPPKIQHTNQTDSRVRLSQVQVVQLCLCPSLHKGLERGLMQHQDGCVEHL
jgi:hypothetical protein